MENYADRVNVKLLDIYDGDNITATRDDTGATTHRYLHGPLVDMALMDEVENGATDSVRWLLGDHLGSIRQVVDEDGSAMLAEIAYDAFGNITSSDTPATVDVLFGYTGREYDAETGLNYHRARYYDPDTGRWLSEDPIGVIDDANLYRYVGNYTTGATDPTGLYQKSFSGGGSFGGLLDFNTSLPSTNTDYTAWAAPFANAPALGGSGTTSYTASATPKTASRTLAQERADAFNYFSSIGDVGGMNAVRESNRIEAAHRSGLHPYDDVHRRMEQNPPIFGLGDLLLRMGGAVLDTYDEFIDSGLNKIGTSRSELTDAVVWAHDTNLRSNPYEYELRYGWGSYDTSPDLGSHPDRWKASFVVGVGTDPLTYVGAVGLISKGRTAQRVFSVGDDLLRYSDDAGRSLRTVDDLMRHRNVRSANTTSASSANARAALNSKLGALEKAQREAVRVRQLPDGRFRYYNGERPATTPGPTRGNAYVTEWDPATGRVRSWGENYDHAGNVTRVHPKMINGQQVIGPHYPPTGSELGR
jgi:RHS repeat-associated protein